MTASDAQQRATRPSRIPTFASREEEAEFWDTHDFTDYLDELTPSTLRYVGEPMEDVTVTIDPDTMKRVRAEAKQQGIDPAVMIFIYVLEHFQNQDRKQSSAKPDATEPATPS